MAVIANVASQLKTENAYTDGYITDTDCEYLIDNAIDYINLVAGTSIADLSGAAGSKTLTATEAELSAIKTLTGLLLRAYKEKGGQAAIAGFSVQEAISDPHYNVFMELFNNSLKYLRGRAFERV